ncbi:50S ribosomal protein L1 [candidate division WWE3 bacterium]|nr:50S ribosomal protein L1 [candidate division WWE3 bacterium]
MKTLIEALTEIKGASKAKFDEAIEAHINLNIDVKQSDQTFRTTVSLPNGTGKSIKIAVLTNKKVEKADLVLSESDIHKLEKGEIQPGRDFDVLIVEPSFMAKMAKLGPVLGPAGVMPNPKTGTVTENVEAAVESFKKGKIEIRNEANAPIIHTVIGKVSFKDEALVENFKEILMTLKQNRPQKAKPDWIKSIYLKSTMGKAVEVSLAQE